MRSHMIGRELSKEDLKELKENRFADKRRTVENYPTMQNGYNSDGTIKEERVKAQIYELNGIKDK